MPSRPVVGQIHCIVSRGISSADAEALRGPFSGLENADFEARPNLMLRAVNLHTDRLEDPALRGASYGHLIGGFGRPQPSGRLGTCRLSGGFAGRDGLYSGMSAA